MSNIPDEKDMSGMWIKNKTISEGVYGTTRACTLWKNIVSRCSEGGQYQDRFITYKGCSNAFEDFQDFTDWCQSQYGYNFRENNGRYWHIDKDFLGWNSLVYSKDSCIFIPQRVNLILCTRKNDRGDYPLGVRANRSGNFEARCAGINGERVNLGTFKDPYTAHKAWQRHKIQVMHNIYKDDVELYCHDKLLHALEFHIERIENNIKLDQETK